MIRIDFSRAKGLFWLIGTAWTILIITLSLGEVLDHRRIGEELARQEVRAQFNWLVIFREWVAHHGGVYVAVTDHTKPNPYLEIPERDIATPSGKKLTLMNPAYVTRQIYEDFFSKKNIRGRVTSLKPINPINTPDEWERDALMQFEKGAQEKFEFTEMAGKHWLRLISPLYVDRDCLKCHEKQGYKLGDVRGGLSLSAPVDIYFERARQGSMQSIGGLWVVWLLGVGGLVWTSGRILRSLRDREASGKSLAEAQRIAHTGSWEIEAEGDSVTMSDESCAIYGLEEHARLSLETFLSFTLPDDRAAHGQALRGAMAANKGFSLQHRVLRRGGAERVVLSTGEMHAAPGGGPGKMIGTVQDITGKVRADEERLRMQQEAQRLATAVLRAGDGVLITDPEGIIQYVNPAAEEMNGYRLDEMKGKTPRVLKSGQQDRRFYDDLWRTIKAGNIWRGRLVNRKKDGSFYDGEMSISPITGPGGAIVNFVAVMRDVTRESILARSRNYFTSITAHEMRTPLTKLHFAESLLQRAIDGGARGPEAERSMEALRDARESFDRIVAATTVISDMARASGEKPFIRNFIYYDIATALDLAAANMEKEKRDITMEADLSALPKQAQVFSSRGMTQQALDEVISNAVKFTPDGKTVRVSARVSGGHVVVEVEDEGEGVPEDKMEDILIPYYSIENPLTHSTGRYKFHGGGLGLGLTVVKLIMEYHNGSFSFGKKQNGQGMAAVLRFPLAGEGGPADM